MNLVWRSVFPFLLLRHHVTVWLLTVTRHSLGEGSLVCQLGRWIC
jgi:hypothetical protein